MNKKVIGLAFAGVATIGIVLVKRKSKASSSESAHSSAQGITQSEALKQVESDFANKIKSDPTFQATPENIKEAVANKMAERPGIEYNAQAVIASRGKGGPDAPVQQSPPAIPAEAQNEWNSLKMVLAQVTAEIPKVPKIGGAARLKILTVQRDNAASRMNELKAQYPGLSGLGATLHFPTRGMTVVSNALLNLRIAPEKRDSNIISPVGAGHVVGIATGKHKTHLGQRYYQVVIPDAKTSTKEMYPAWVNGTKVKLITPKQLDESYKGKVVTVMRENYKKAGGVVGYYSNNANADFTREVIANSPTSLIDEDMRSVSTAKEGVILGHPIAEISNAAGKFVKFKSMNGFTWLVPKENVSIKQI